MSIPSVTSSAVQFVSPQATSAGMAGPASGTETSAPAQAVNRAGKETAAPDARAKTAAELDPAKLQEAVEQAQASLQAIARDITFSLNEKSGTVVIKVIERESKEVIRQIPSEEFLKIAEMLNDNIADIRAGLLVEQKA